jgi:hypothetical protein
MMRILIVVLTVVVLAACPGPGSESRTRAAADVVLVVDNTGGMADEVPAVAGSLNDFAAAVEAAGVSLNLILISADDSQPQGICVPAPLGSGGCPQDEKLPQYRHVQQSVGSQDSLQLILDTYDQWSSSLRPGASRHIAVVTDDDSSLGASTFTTQLIAVDPSFQQLVLSAFVVDYDPGDPFDPCKQLASARGDQYLALIASTGGVFGNLCDQDVGAWMQSLAPEVVDGAGTIPAAAQTAVVGPTR